MTEHTPIRVMVVDDHGLFRDGIVEVLRSQPDIEVVGEAGDGLEACVLAQSLRPDVVLLDINMPGMDGIEAARVIAREVPSCQIVMLTVRDEDDRIFEALRGGASGYLLKTIRGQQLIEMVRAAARGEAAVTPAIATRLLAAFRATGSLAGPSPVPAPHPIRSDAGDDPDALTAREQEILALIAAGRSDKEIAAELMISLYTVKAHVRAILAKLHVTSRREAARRMGGSGKA
ncbi:MAG: response regulator transcription factor [Oscillochloridaceae bacterium]|nr:response regulator transcription factor [Chloroflexaceae bacterium]MDW8391862.1 response regulator transcription factor [Oscillochloridaceae bacterium]